MLTHDDFRFILKEIEEIEKIEKEEQKYSIQLMLFESVEEKDFSITYIDSSFVYGIVGPYVYVYARAAAISKDNIDIIRDFIILPDTFFLALNNNMGSYEKLDLEDIGEIVSKNLEYKLASGANTDYVIIDGSLLSDLILYDKSYSLLDKKLDERYNEFRDNFFKIFKSGLFSIAKRILHAHFITDNERISDFLILLSKFPFQEFYTQVFTKDLSRKIRSLNKSIKAIYFRPRPGDHIYRLETPEDTDNKTMVEMLYNVIYKRKKYPFGLKLAHNKSKITNREKSLIEYSLRKMLGYDKTIGWETK